MRMNVAAKSYSLADKPDAAEVRILLIDNDELLLSDLRGLGCPELAIENLEPADSVDVLALAGRCDVVVINIDAASGFGLLERAAPMDIGPAVIALAGQGVPGRTLEHTLTLAELRGAAVALPKPIDAVELALAAIRAIGRMRMPSPDLTVLAEKLERRLLV
ncbi:MAG: hypothetical protein GC155_15140 [Alphaproteobacteria bacterium]|nr:hypothetical protein [Alphaproteobacteria bacterium]